MILVTRLDRQSMFLNPDHIVSVEETPDTVITLFNGHHILVREHCQVILNRIIAFRTKILRRSSAVPNGLAYLRRQRNTQYHRTESEHHLSAPDHRTTLQPLHRQDT
ncbi:MAG: flagellar FlbD family protein [Trichlorobacter sp.]|uniref:flagellar FlbD family protein n=1 Tax=Trichlorobacter sp. TaxID=2911007 RepID=UPI0025632B72|nr:flagellar FlbD family protein [Trichlorobacter sp.]MDK9717554.1 flagellar FlbD family protein [Trichlorobacter sp.]